MADGVMKKVLIIGIGAGNPDYGTFKPSTPSMKLMCSLL